MTSDTPVVVDVVAIELTDSRDDDTVDPVIFDNAIGFNDFRGTALQITLTPEELEDHNDISRNLGDNRGHGLHPSLFSPDGQVQQIADPVGVSMVWGSCVPIQRVSSNLCAGEHGNMFSVQLTGFGASK